MIEIREQHHSNITNEHMTISQANHTFRDSTIEKQYVTM